MAFNIRKWRNDSGMKERFLISWIVENGYPHYKVHDKVTGRTVHCDEGELNETIWKMMGV